MQVLALSADLNNSGRRPSKRVPLRREVSATPRESWGARAHVLVSCGGSCKGVRCGSSHGRTPTRIDRGQRREAAIYSEAAPGPARAALARRRAGGLPHRPASPLRSSQQVSEPTQRDDDQGPTAAQVCPHHNMYNSLPRRTGQWGSVFGPRRVCRARLEGHRRDLRLRLRLLGPRLFPTTLPGGASLVRLRVK